MKANAVNLATFANALCHCNATPLSVVVLVPYAWGEDLACGVAWQSMLLGRNGVWQSVLNSAKHSTAWRGEFGNETAQRGKFSLASVAKWAVLVGEASTAKMEQCLGGGLLSLSLSLSLVARTCGTPLR